MDEIFPNQIQLFKSVFKGREDVFAVRWEKDNKNGYMPAYFYDPFCLDGVFIAKPCAGHETPAQSIK